jgi:hypothetical protein
VSRDLADMIAKTAQYEVILDETIKLEKCGEYFVRGKIRQDGELSCTERDILFVSDRHRLSRRNILAADALYNTSNLTDGLIMIRIINPMMMRNTIYKGTILGKIMTFNNDSVFMFDNMCDKSYDDVLNEILTSHSECLNNEEFESLRTILKEYKSIFSRSSTDVGLIKGYKHEIETHNHIPVCMNPRRIPLNVEDKVDALVEDLEKKGIVKKTTSPWNSPIVVVPKKNGEIRLCVDYRQLNSITERPVYHIPDARQLFDTLDCSEYFSALDLSLGYHQIEMEKRDREKTAFTTRTGQYCFKRMPFGLCGAPQSFQRTMAAILRNQNWKSCILYLDDILIFGSNLKEHNQRLRSVLLCLSKAGVKLSPGKCIFMRNEVKYLGHVISKHGIRTDPSKISKIKEWPIPNTVKELKTFISLCGYYRKFVENFAEIVRPLEILCQDKKKNKTLCWEEKHTIAWNTLKDSLCKAPILSFPRKHGTYILDTDASHGAIGAVLSQIQEGQEKVISYASHALGKHELQYCVTRKELLAVYKYVRYFQHYLLGCKFIIRTDHRALIWMLNWRKPSTSQYCSWKAELELYNFEIMHRKGEEHINADSMSRFPHCKQCALTHDNPCPKTNVKMIAQVTDVDKISAQDVVESMIECINKGEQIDYLKRIYPNMAKEISQLLKYRNNLMVVDGKLMLKKSKKILHVPPVQNRNEIIMEMHSQFGHPGIFKMMALIKEHFYWPFMDVDINISVNNCKLCKQFKPQPSPKKTKGRLIAKFPFDKIAVDITGPLKITKLQNRYILGITDHFSKYTVLVPLRTTDSETIIEAIFSRWISVFGIPNSIHSDRGSNFTSHQMFKFCEALRIKKTSSTPYYPQGDGVIERIFKTVKPMIGIVTAENGIEWDKALPIVEFGLRNTRSRQTGFTPNEILFGKNVFLDVSTNSVIDVKNENTVSDYVDTLLCKIKTITDEVVEKNIEQDTDRINKFRKGDWVWVKRIGSKCGNILYDGPFQIADEIGLNAYRISTGEGKTFDRNAIYLKLGHPPEKRGSIVKDTSIISASTDRPNNCLANDSPGRLHHRPPYMSRMPRRTLPARKRRPPERFGIDVNL